MNRRKRRRRYTKPYRNNSMKNKALSFVLVICVSVSAGYLTATYILGPVLGLEPQPSFLDFINDDKKQEDEKKNEKKETEILVDSEAEAAEKSGFAVQYGSFSSKAGAEEHAHSLKESGVTVKIIETDGMFKVIGKIFDTKEAARTYMEEKHADNDDLFITEIP